ncbi:hypothetical protein C923_01668 [Plasmodium falciparum UGT5.1]|uniref:Uncharacterized protein n=2 Tax=Plasmodium falciparum TaxID=5833 RepID=W7K1B0_PLAFA|nr:hypothetical protein PFBG_01584 [Plasmodium falciparum 7G8]EWC77681.1 hypothetical protein C923_01668 [Plasmodium falciparum UGT5.1]
MFYINEEFILYPFLCKLLLYNKYDKDINMLVYSILFNILYFVYKKDMLMKSLSYHIFKNDILNKTFAGYKQNYTYHFF